MSNDEAQKPQVCPWGLPTDEQIRKLREAYPVDSLANGRVISYKEVTEIIGKKRGESRFYTITNRWRKLLMNEHNILIGCKRGEGFCVETPSERVDSSERHVRSGIKKIRRGGRVAVTTPTEDLTPIEAARVDHIARRAADVLLADRAEKRRFRCSLPAPVGKTNEPLPEGQ